MHLSLAKGKISVQVQILPRSLLKKYMSRETSEMVIFSITAIVLSFLMGVLIDNMIFKNEAIQKGYAEYNQTTGDWQWKTNIHNIKND